MKRINFILILAVSSFAFSVFTFVYLNKGEEKIGYVDINLLYEGFNYKIELEEKIIERQNNVKTELDSIKMNFEILYKEVQNNGSKQNELDRLKVLQENFLFKENAYKQELEDLKQTYQKQILTQLNQYIRNFGDEKGYRYILGASSDGSIMYASESDNITNEVLDYINMKYEGIEK